MSGYGRTRSLRETDIQRNVTPEKCQWQTFRQTRGLEPKLFRCGFANYASVLAVLAKCSTNRRVCAGSASLRRRQTINCRTAHVSVSRSVLNAMVRRQRVAAVSGTTAIPTPDSTMRQAASSPRSRIRGFRDRPRRVDCHARCSASALPVTRPTNSSSSKSTNAMLRRPANAWPRGTMTTSLSMPKIRRGWSWACRG